MPASRDDLPEAVDGWRRGEGADSPEHYAGARSARFRKSL
jgi:hypothetical protein